MNSRHHRLIGILILLLGLAASYVALAQTVEVTGAEPGSAPPATYGLDVIISGAGFDKSAKVKFLKSKTGKPADIVVNRSKVDGSTQITVNIDVSDTATDQDLYDIEVKMSRGRGGKGTTLFKVDSSASAAPNNDGHGIPMTCAINEESEPFTTVGNDEGISGVGSWLYTGGMEKVFCGSGDVVSGRLAGLRLRTDGGGNLKNSVRFLDLNFDPACPTGLEDPDYCIPAESALLSRLPPDFREPSLDTAQLDVRPYVDANPPHNHIHLMASNLYAMRMAIEPKGFGERYLIRMSSRGELPEGALQSRTCAYSEENATEDITVYIWQDGVFSGVSNGLPDGYTVTTGDIDPTKLESLGLPPTVTPGFAQGILCSNIGLGGEPCEGGGKNKNALCHTLGKVPVRFTMHMEYQ